MNPSPQDIIAQGRRCITLRDTLERELSRRDAMVRAAILGWRVGAPDCRTYSPHQVAGWAGISIRRAHELAPTDQVLSLIAGQVSMEDALDGDSPGSAAPQLEPSDDGEHRDQ